MATTNPASGKSATHDPRRIAFAASSPAIPTYIGFRLIEFAPVLTKTEVRSGCIGSTVVPLRRNWFTEAAANDVDANATVVAAAIRRAVGAGAPRVSAR